LFLVITSQVHNLWVACTEAEAMEVQCTLVNLKLLNDQEYPSYQSFSLVTGGGGQGKYINKRTKLIVN
jgi:hypothetical protein